MYDFCNAHFHTFGSIFENSLQPHDHENEIYTQLIATTTLCLLSCTMSTT
jgi:hypothetical protein